MATKYADIIIDISHEAVDKTFQYRIPEALLEKATIGAMVQVPFGSGNRKRKGYIVGISEIPLYDVDKIKEIIDIPEKSLKIEGKLIKLAAWMRETYGSTMNHALQTVMPVKEYVKRAQARVELPAFELKNPPVLTLNEAQQKLVDEFREDYDQGVRNTYLLHGITGSGKTEVYIGCIHEVIKTGGQAIVLIPEIALTYQNVARLKQHFGDRIALIHSKQSKGEKCAEMVRAKNHEVDVIVGPRSALFIPCDNLKLIIIDEEHDMAYKSEQVPKYHARETAIYRAGLEDASVILGSATPSLDSYASAAMGEYKLWELDKRPEGMLPSEVSVVDLREELRMGNRSIISLELKELIEDRLKKKEQIMLFINRRGYNSFVSCRECGEVIKCPHCDVSLSLHGNARMMCHYCGYTIDQPKQCPSCSSKLIGGFGTGTEKVEAEILKLFPEAKTLRMDKDTTMKKGAHGDIINRFIRKEADILIGTQMIVKGHDFSNVTLVGIILADMSLLANDYRAGERTFSLLTQAAGRAGRSSKLGHVLIQTYQPDHYAIASAAKQDYKGFFEMEMSYRRLMGYPPVSKMFVVLLMSDRYEDVKQASDILGEQLKAMVRDKKKVHVIGPSDATIGRINEVYRRVLYVKTSEEDLLQELKNQADTFTYENVSLTVDVDPMAVY